MRIERDWQAGDTITLCLPMQVSVVQVDDRDLMNKQPLAVEYGPLLFALPISEEWKPYPGKPVTPVSEDWYWFQVRPKEVPMDAVVHNMYGRYAASEYNYAMHPDTRAEDIRVELCDPAGYVWEQPPLRLIAPLHKAKYAYPTYPRTNIEVYDAPVPADPTPQPKALVPFGCTARRISYFPRAKTE